MPRGKVMQHFLKGENVALCTHSSRPGSKVLKIGIVMRSLRDPNIFESSLVSNKTSEIVVTAFPLSILYPDARQQHIDQQRIPNLDQDIVEVIAKGLALRFTPEKQEDDTNFAPVDILDYIYAILHSPSYRERYQEFLKTDFPKVPYPTDKELFRKLAKLGGDLRSLHLMEHSVLQQPITGYNIPGSNQVEKLDFKSGKPNEPDRQCPYQRNAIF